MVSIDNFFKKGTSGRHPTKGQSATAPGSSSSVEKDGASKSVIDLVDSDKEDLGASETQSSQNNQDMSLEILDEDPQPKKRSRAAPSRAQIPTKASQQDKQKASASPQKKARTTKPTKAQPPGSGSLEELLSKIPSIDLDAVHVKESVGFDFRANAQGDASSQVPADGSDFPEGEPNCLLGLTIVFTGQLPTLERGTAEAIAKRYGARVTKSISSKTSLVVLGDEAGPKKLEKIKQLEIKAIDEEGFKQLVSGMPAEGGDNTAAEKARQKLKQQEEAAQDEAREMVKREQEQREKLKNSRQADGTVKDSKHVTREEDKLWTVKYAPTSLNHICGNKTSVAKLRTWLTNWRGYQKQDFKQPGKDGLGVFRAAMLYGPPGIGKTTAAHLVAKELGYDVLEKNASDVRSKSLLNAGVKNALDNTSIVGFFKSKEDGDVNQRKFVIIMDEVDGMSGGDRGGVGQMALFCRKTSMPMILICNERNTPKMRPFDRVCLDVQFRRPDVNSVKARLMTIAVREKFQLDPNIIERLVEATRGDIRQLINLLSTISTTTKKIGHENAQKIAQAWEKNIALKPFDIAHKLFDGRIYSDIGSKSFPLYKKMELYFDDFDFAPLMIQENYLQTRPSVLKPGETHLSAVADAAESISQGDLVERKIRSSEQQWSLLPFHAIMSSVRPASAVAGQMAGRINFTSWLGQNSKTGKFFRQLQELQYHTRLSTSTDKLGLRMDYMPTMKRRLLDPLVNDGGDGISEVIQTMDDYYLSKEDWDSIMEFMIGNDKTDAQIKKIPTAVKSGFTRKYNAMIHPVAIYKTGSTTAVGAKSKATPDFEDIVDADDEVPPADDEEEQKDDTDFKKDKLIKQGRPKATKKRPASAAKKAPAKKRKA
ncbi:LANO_0H14774g1_1 [Lachancea nothofagi CBS 11611]|uniref:Replication factor C subunit 1 n=1 Tax=Lachancea nothofagi CBS 11611 TaxID=1266666 RepID=A0A1G4KMV2_9SACH|nr:LANO_0H14774g1_1 [Lachancea nothofagi CBS 11611]